MDRRSLRRARNEHPTDGDLVTGVTDSALDRMGERQGRAVRGAMDRVDERIPKAGRYISADVVTAVAELLAEEMGDD